MNEDQAALIGEQIAHFRTQVNARLDAIEMLITHHKELEDEKHQSINRQLAELRAISADHESRIRLSTDGVTQFKTWSGLASGGSSILSIIALLKAFFYP
jgi:hypothetical protein